MSLDGQERGGGGGGGEGGEEGEGEGRRRRRRRRKKKEKEKKKKKRIGSEMTSNPLQTCLALIAAFLFLRNLVLSGAMKNIAS